MNGRRTFYSSLLIVLSILFLLVVARPAAAQQDCTGNESWIDAGGGLPGPVFASTEMDGKLYVFHLDGPMRDSALHQISVWDGRGWSLVTSFKLRGYLQTDLPYRLGGFQGFNGNLYLAGDFFYGDGNDMRTFIRWDGTEWSSAMTNMSLGDVISLGVHDGRLIASATAEGQGWKIVQFDGAEWTYVGGKESQKENNGYATAIISWNGDLYVGGSSFLLGEGKHAVAARWDGAKWISMGIKEQGVGASIRRMYVYNTQLYAVGSWPHRTDEALAWWDGADWITLIPQPTRRLQSGNVIVHNDEAYLIFSSKTNRSKGIIGEYENIERFDGAEWRVATNFNGPVRILASFNGKLIAAGDFDSTCGTPVANAAQLCNDMNCGKVTGNVYYDRDEDCMRDSAELGLARRIVEFTPGSHYAITDANGNYSRHLDSGSYTVALRRYTHWNTTCPAPPGTHAVTLTGSSSIGDIDFATQPGNGVQYLRVSAVAGMARRGRQFVYAITYDNAGSTTMNGTVRLFHDPMLTFDSASTPATRYTPNVAEWDFTDLKIEESRTIKVYTTVPITAHGGTLICSRVEIDPQSNDFSIDTRDSICTAVTGSYDPNDISVTPYGVEDNGIITPEDSVLTYRVRFQNTGNDTAFKVVVVDQLSSNLDISSIRLGAASHPYSFSIDKDNVLTWTFDDIMLPDSNASEINSHGFFKFSVNLKPNLAYGTEIPNHVDIYFDYNAPVRTNTVVSIIGASMGVEPTAHLTPLYLYPNPARDIVQIQSELQSGSSITLRNLLGETLRSYSHTEGGAITLDVRDLPAGNYLLTLETPEGPRTERITILR